jgi:DNA-binding NtrC family response regulator
VSIARKEVLIVDDDLEIRFFLRKILENLGMSVSEAESVPVALEKYNERSPHLVITDLDMQPESGYSLLQHLKSITGELPVPVIVLSGKDDKNSIQQAMNLGVCEFISKPLNSAKFIQKVRKTIRGEELARYELPKPACVSITVPGRIVAASEIGFRITAAIRLDPQTNVQVKSDYLSELAVQDLPLKSGPVLAKTVPSGRYNIEIRLAGVTREISARTRKLMISWK